MDNIELTEVAKGHHSALKDYGERIETLEKGLMRLAEATEGLSKLVLNQAKMIAEMNEVKL